MGAIHMRIGIASSHCGLGACPRIQDLDGLLAFRCVVWARADTGRATAPREQDSHECSLRRSAEMYHYLVHNIMAHVSRAAKAIRHFRSSTAHVLLGASGPFALASRPNPPTDRCLSAGWRRNGQDFIYALSAIRRGPAEAWLAPGTPTGSRVPGHAKAVRLRAPTG